MTEAPHDDPAQVRLRGTQATMLVTVRARADHGRTRRPVLRDPWAEAVMSRLDPAAAPARLDPWAAFMISARAAKFDLWTSRFVQDHPDALVLHLGCGLDARAQRVGAPASVRWVEVDLPAVMAWRDRLLPCPTGVLRLAADVTTAQWWQQVPGDGPALVVAEGLSMYLDDAGLAGLLGRVVDRCGRGQVLLDVHSRAVTHGAAGRRVDVHGTGAHFTWGLDDPAELVALEPRLRWVDEFPTSALPGFAALPRRFAWAARVWDRIGPRAFALSLSCWSGS